MRNFVHNAVSGYTLNEGRWKIEPFYFQGHGLWMTPDNVRRLFSIIDEIKSASTSCSLRTTWYFFLQFLIGETCGHL